MTTGMEAAQSISITVYYKGFSMIITKRDAEAEVKPLIDSSVKAIDYMIANGFKPSWNEDTNKQALGQSIPSVTTTTASTNSKPCPIHPDKKLFYNADGKFGPFWSHKTDEVNGNGKPIYCNGVDKSKKMTVEEYERVQADPEDYNF